MLTGYKTYILGIGLVCYGIYQLTQSNYDAGIQSILGGLAALGLRSAQTTEANRVMQELKK